MKFFCEYCGNVIDANEDDKCPNCGASYKKNESFKKIQEEKKLEEQQNNEFKQQVRSHALGALKVSKWIIFIPIIMFIVVLSIIVFSIVSFNKTSNQVNEGVNSIFDSINNQMKDQLEENLEEQKESEKVTVGFDEFGTTDKYKVKVTKYEGAEDIYRKLESGYELIKIHLIVENISNDELTKEKVNCIVDGVAQNNYISSGYSDLPMFIQRDLAVKGTTTFQIPIGTKSFDIKYGDYITIHIER